MTDALLVIDMQQGMFGFPGYPPHDGEGVVARIGALIDQARKKRTPIFFVQHAGPPGDPLATDNPGFAIHQELAPKPNESVTVKNVCSAFQNTDLDAKLKAAGATHLIICGMQSDFCVDTAVRAAFERGYKVTLVGDGHSTMDNGVLKAADIVRHHNKTLSDMFARVMPAAEIAFD